MPPIRRRRRAVPPSAAVLLACALLLLAAGCGPALAAGPRDPELQALRRAIETAFRRCETAPLEGSFSPRVKTYLSSRALGVRPGYYGADQALLILKRGFSGRRTLRFTLAKMDDVRESDGRRVVPARWRFRDDRTESADVRLSLTLAREAASWTLREIREMK